MFGQLYSLSSSVYAVPAPHDERRAAIQGSAERRAYLKQWDPSLEASWHLHPWRAQDLSYSPGQCDLISSLTLLALGLGPPYPEALDEHRVIDSSFSPVSHISLLFFPARSFRP